MSDVKYYMQGLTKAVCPYFIRESTRTITCEGFVNDAKSTLSFMTPTQKLDFQREHCFCYDSECPVREKNNQRFE